jgi:tRNA threonylcarbamoyladenosine biosynthesis protein TsaE
MAVVTLQSLEDTCRLGRLLAEGLRALGPVALLLRGPLGSGKTTLAAALVAALPGGTAAEVASPSFTICNYYPTTPPVLHADLYRSPGAPPEELEEALDQGRSQILLEWAEYLPQALLPEEYLDISVDACEKGRLLTLTPCGRKAGELLRLVCGRWSGEA